MKITIESTDDFAAIGIARVPVRLWIGTAEDGSPVVALVALVGVHGSNPVPGLLPREVIIKDDDVGHRDRKPENIP